jgi:uncharacterized protein
MLTSTFIHIPGIGPKKEQAFWTAGMHSWQKFLEAGNAIALSQKRRDSIHTHLEASLSALEGRDHRFFANSLAHRDHWRAFPDFADSVAYLDIETTGMDESAIVTMVGVYDGQDYRAYIHGENLDKFPDDIGQYRLLVTYFGAGFDLPFLLRYFPFLRFEQLHIDLCPLLRRLGYKGGLKHVEEALGIRRPEEVRGMDGFEAVRLWWEYERGNTRALERLVQYNREDVVNLKALMQFGYQHSAEALQAPFSSNCEPAV